MKTLWTIVVWVSLRCSDIGNITKMVIMMIMSMMLFYSSTFISSLPSYYTLLPIYICYHVDTTYPSIQSAIVHTTLSIYRYAYHLPIHLFSMLSFTPLYLSIYMHTYLSIYSVCYRSHHSIYLSICIPTYQSIQSAIVHSAAHPSVGSSRPRCRVLPSQEVRGGRHVLW